MLCYHAVTRLPSSLLVYIMYIFLTNVLDFGCGKVGETAVTRPAMKTAKAATAPG